MKKPAMLLLCLLLLASPLSAGTRIFRELEEVLGMNQNCAVLEARVLSTSYQSQHTSDVMIAEVEPIWLYRPGDFSPQPGRHLVFSAYRPPPSTDGSTGVYTPPARDWSFNSRRVRSICFSAPLAAPSLGSREKNSLRP